MRLETAPRGGGGAKIKNLTCGVDLPDGRCLISARSAVMWPASKGKWCSVIGSLRFQWINVCESKARAPEQGRNLADEKTTNNQFNIEPVLLLLILQMNHLKIKF